MTIKGMHNERHFVINKDMTLPICLKFYEHKQMFNDE
jgi:hypothetical protein